MHLILQFLEKERYPQIFMLDLFDIVIADPALNVDVRGLGDLTFGVP